MMQGKRIGALLLQAAPNEAAPAWVNEAPAGLIDEAQPAADPRGLTELLRVCDIVLMLPRGAAGDVRALPALAALVAEGLCDVALEEIAPATDGAVNDAAASASANATPSAAASASANATPSAAASASANATPSVEIRRRGGFEAWSRAALTTLLAERDSESARPADTHSLRLLIQASHTPETLRQRGFRVGTVTHPPADHPDAEGMATVALGEQRQVDEVAVSAGGAARHQVTMLLCVLIVLTVLPALFSLSQAASFARLAVVSVTPVRTVQVGTPGMRALTDAQGMIASTDGSLLLAEGGGRRLLQFPDGSSGSVVALASPDAPFALQQPSDVALAPDGTIFLLDRATGVVHRLDRQGRPLGQLRIAGPGARALTVDRAGRLLIADTQRGVVRAYRADGAIATGWGERPAQGETPVGVPIGIAVLGDGVLVAAEDRRDLVRLSPEGRIVGRAAGIGNIGWLTAISADRALMSDLPTNRVWLLDGTGRTLGRLVGPGGNEFIFAQPRGIAAPGDGCLYVANDTRIDVYRTDDAQLPLSAPGVAPRC